MDCVAKESSLIDRCIDIRAILSEALDRAEGITSKLIGSGDGEAGAEPRPVVESVQSVLGDISRLAHRLNKSFMQHHEILGVFAPQDGRVPQPRVRA